MRLCYNTLARLVDFPTPLTPQKVTQYGLFCCLHSIASRKISTRLFGERIWTQDSFNVCFTVEAIPTKQHDSLKCLSTVWQYLQINMTHSVSFHSGGNTYSARLILLLQFPLLTTGYFTLQNIYRWRASHWLLLKPSGIRRVLYYETHQPSFLFRIHYYYDSDIFIYQMADLGPYHTTNWNCDYYVSLTASGLDKNGRTYRLSPTAIYFHVLPLKFVFCKYGFAVIGLLVTY